MEYIEKIKQILLDNGFKTVRFNYKKRYIQGKKASNDSLKGHKIEIKAYKDYE